MKIWMSSSTSRDNRYSLHIIGGIFGIVLVMMVLVVAGTLLIPWLGLPREISSLILCLAVTGLITWLAFRLGKKSVQDTLVFLLTDQQDLFVLDSRQLTPYHRNFIGFIQDTMKTQKLLDQINQYGLKEFLPSSAELIGEVLQIQEKQHNYQIICRVAKSNLREYTKKIRIAGEWDDLPALLSELEKRKVS